MKLLDAVAPHSAAVPHAEIERGDASLVRRFLAWAPKASADERAEAVNALARAYLHSPLSSAARAEAALALTSVLDDSSAHVRRALAQAFASAADAPRHIVLALAGDQSEVARVVLARSPLFEDAELVDCAAIGDVAAQIAIARRARVSASVAAALAEIGEKAAVCAVIVNPGAQVGSATLRRAFERFGDEADMREAMLTRPNLPAWLLGEIALKSASSLSDFVAGRGWLDARRAERIAREAREQAFVTLAITRSPEEVDEFVAWLRRRGALTVALMMRALMHGDLELFKRGLADMSGLPARRIAGFMREYRGHGFASAYAKGNMPPHLLGAFRAALAVVAANPREVGRQVSHVMTSELIQACEGMNQREFAPLLSMLWRLASESAREDARDFAREASVPEVLPMLERLELAEAENDSPLVTIDIRGVNDSVAPRVELELKANEDQDVADAA